MNIYYELSAATLHNNVTFTSVAKKIFKSRESNFVLFCVLVLQTKTRVMKATTILKIDLFYLFIHLLLLLLLLSLFKIRSHTSAHSLCVYFVCPAVRARLLNDSLPRFALQSFMFNPICFAKCNVLLSPKVF